MTRVMDLQNGYPITPEGKNFYAKSDNRDTKGGCFAGRDVHSNPNKDKDGVGTPEHLNEIGKWMQSNVSNIGNGKGGKGLWCTNCHNQLSRELNIDITIFIFSHQGLVTFHRNHTNIRHHTIFSPGQ
jgi:hypothetical protein